MAKSDTDKLGIVMRRTPAGLAPVSAWDSERLDGITYGTDVEVTVKQRRSLPHHRWFFKALSRVVASGAVPFQSVDELLDALKLSCGVTQLRQGIGGTPYVMPGSISFAAKDQPKFKAFAERAELLIDTHYRVNLSEIMADSQREAA